MEARKVLIALALIGFTAVIIAQTSPAKPTRMKWVSSGGSSIEIEAGNTQERSPMVQLTGGVRLTVDGTVINADTATVDLRGGEIQLTGSVRLKLK